VFTTTFATTLRAGAVVTATASHVSGDTSEFSPCRRVEAPGDWRSPGLHIPRDMTLIASSTEGLKVSFVPFAIDETDPKPLLQCAPPSGSLFPVGVKQVVCTATDASGNSTNAAFTITVLPPDTRPVLDICHDLANEQVTVSWPVWFKDYTLQVTSRLADPNSWTDWPEPVVIVGQQNMVSFRPARGQPVLFFHLVQSSAIPLHGDFRVTLTGFRVNRQTLDDQQERDGVGDEVMFINDVGVVSDDGSFRRLIGPARASRSMGQAPPNSVRAGRGSNGGLRTDDNFPDTRAPWLVSTPMTPDVPPVVLFEGSLIQAHDAAVIIPTLWERDVPDTLQVLYAEKMRERQTALVTAVLPLIQAPPSTAVVPGRALGLGDMVTHGCGLVEDGHRPIGTEPFFDRFSFSPKVLVLTYDVARELARRTDGPSRGVIEIRYVDHQCFEGDYSLFLKIEDLTSSPAACAPLTATFTGSAELTTTHPNERLRGPFRRDGLRFDVRFTDCRTVVSVPMFPTISEPLVGFDNTVTLRRVDSSAGTFSPTSGRLTLPIELLMTHTHPLVGDSTIQMTLTTDGGATVDNAGGIVLVGRREFRGGFFNGHEGRIEVRGTLSPNPRP